MKNCEILIQIVNANTFSSFNRLDLQHGYILLIKKH